MLQDDGPIMVGPIVASCTMTFEFILSLDKSRRYNLTQALMVDVVRGKILRSGGAVHRP
jgi:hypothetical protein